MNHDLCCLITIVTHIIFGKLNIFSSKFYNTILLRWDFAILFLDVFPRVTTIIWFEFLLSITLPCIFCPFVPIHLECILEIL